MKSISKMTVKELKSYIKENTISVNQALKSYYESGEDISTVNKQISKLKQLSGISKKDNKYIIANFRGKKKVELVRQARELTYFSNWDIDTPLGIEQASERERKAYEDFSSKPEFKNIEYDEWRGLVEAFGALGDKLNMVMSTETLLIFIAIYQKMNVRLIYSKQCKTVLMIPPH